MSIADSSLCLVPGQTRKIWLVNPQTGISYASEQRWWSRDPGNCNCSAISPLCSEANIENQKIYKNQVLEHTIASSIQYVSGKRTKSNLYSYYARGNKNGLTKSHTFSIQNTRGYANPNNLNLPLQGNLQFIPPGPFISPSRGGISGITSRQVLLCPLNFK